MKVIKLSTWAKENDYSYRGAYNRYIRGDLPEAYKTSTGGIVIPIKDTNKPLKTIVYCRVSSNKQKEDLERQVDRMTEFSNKNGWVVDKIVKEIASGLNDKRPKLQKILDDNENFNIRIVVEYKDRLTRFGFNYIESLLNGEIVVANPNISDKDDLMQDLISVITSMVARYYGNRRGSKKTKEIIKKLK
jgi:predicted site-specific integrase-resolvase